MTIYILGIVIIGLIVLFVLEKKRLDFFIKDYSSNKKQNQTFLPNLGGFSFNDKSVSNSQVKHDVFLLKRVLYYAQTINKTKKHWLKKLIKEMSKKNITFHNGLNYDKAVAILNLGLEDIVDLVTADKFCIMSKIFDGKNFQEFIEDKDKNKMAQNYGITEDDIKEYSSLIGAEELIRNTNFINNAQYKNLSELLDNINPNNKNDVENLAQKLEQILTEEQKEELNKYYIKYIDIAKSILSYGENRLYRLSKIEKYFPELKENTTENRDVLANVFKGLYSVDWETKEILKDKVTKPVQENFVPNNKNKEKFRNYSKKIAYAEAIPYHNKLNPFLGKLQKQFIKIPRILVNFDSHPDIVTDTKPKGTPADWINTVINEYMITEIYWVIPTQKMYDINYRRIFFEKKGKMIYEGNYSNSISYRDFSKPLKQTFLTNVENGCIVADSINYTKEETQTALETGKYRKITIYTCTEENLPYIKKDFILSIDADYFNNNGYDSPSEVEHIPFNINRIFNNFISETWKKKLTKATILCLCLSYEYVGLEKIGITRSFYEFIIKEISKNIRGY